MTAADWLLLLIAASDDPPIDPVRVQKGLFLLAMERTIPEGERYAFEPYSYGPMSRAVYRDARALEAAGLDESVSVARYGWRALRATPAGRRRVADLPAAAVAAAIRETIDGRSFGELLDHVYERCPEYATRSVFKRS